MRFFTVREFAAMFHLAEITVRKMILQGRIAHSRFGRAVRISSEEVKRIRVEGIGPVV